MLVQEMVKRRLSLMRGTAESLENPIVQIVSDGIGAKVILGRKSIRDGEDESPQLSGVQTKLVRFEIVSSRVCFEIAGAMTQMGEWLKQREDEAQRERAATAGGS